MNYPIDATHAGVSDKYGQVYVEKVGNNGFPDRDEPVALLRAADAYAYTALIHYLNFVEWDPKVPREQVESVRRQVERFTNWRRENHDKIRLPGTTPVD